MIVIRALERRAKKRKAAGMKEPGKALASLSSASMEWSLFEGLIKWT
jgi:hypothetical protein